MKMIRIPRNETEPVKQILKKLKPFTYYVNSYEIIFSLHNTILKFEASGSIYEINLKLVIIFTRFFIRPMWTLERRMKTL